MAERHVSLAVLPSVRRNLSSGPRDASGDYQDHATHALAEVLGSTLQVDNRAVARELLEGVRPSLRICGAFVCSCTSASMVRTEKIKDTSDGIYR